MREVSVGLVSDFPDSGRMTVDIKRFERTATAGHGCERRKWPLRPGADRSADRLSEWVELLVHWPVALCVGDRSSRKSGRFDSLGEAGTY